MSIPNVQSASALKSELEIKYLGDETIYFYTKPKKGRSKVPPPTPAYDMDFDRNFEIPEININEVDEIPEVQEEGIKFTIENLGKRLGCDNYEYDLIQFWFLDILTDCLWKAQDIFQFDSNEQRIILKWVTEIFKIIADKSLNISRKGFLKIFKLVIVRMYREISERSESFPTTDIIREIVKELFQVDVIAEEDAEDSSSSSTHSETTMSSLSKDKLRIVPNFNIQEHIKALKTHNPLNNLFNSHSEDYFDTIDLSEGDEEVIERSQNTDLSNISFYRPDTITPPRFRSSYQGMVGFIDTCHCHYPKSWVDDSSTSDEYYADSFRLNPLDYKTPSSIHLEQSNLEVSDDHYNPVHKSESKVIIDYLTQKPSTKLLLELSIEEVDEYESDVQVLKEWAYFKLMEQRGIDMDNPRIGWVPWASFLKEREDVPEENESIRSYSTVTTEQNLEDESIELKFKMMKAIVDFVFEYFYENFHFTLIKFAFRSTPNIITQKLNDKWHTPKIIKQDFKRPKASPVKKEKKTKKKKEKRKKSKSPKRKKDKKSKKSKKGKVKKEKPKKLTKEELARKRLEEAMLEEEKRRILENKVYMFPLADAASEDLFMAIFENWVAGGKKKDKRKKGKKGKKKK